MVDSLADISGFSAPHAVARMAREEPDKIALSVDGVDVSYRELDASADRVAAWLVEELGTGNHFVAARLAGVEKTAVAALAVDRSGKVWVPIDPEAPHERVRAILAEVDARVLFTDVEDEDTRAAFGGIVADPSEVSAACALDVVEVSDDDLALVTFTSGSTGKPKGIVYSVAARRDGLADMVRPYADEDPGTARHGAIWVGTVGASAYQVWIALLLGHTFVPYDIRRSGLTGWRDWMARERISHIPLVPTIWRFLAPTLSPGDIFPDLRSIRLIGEASTWDDAASIRRHLPPEATLANFFGLTEVMVSRFDVKHDLAIGSGPLPAGHPIRGRHVEIVGPDGVEVPTGESGEIVVRTKACATGYWQMPEATERVFERLADGWVRVHTGDAGRLLPDGSLQHLGRLDHMVKISGNRVELGDVENSLRSLDGVANAAVAVFVGPDGENRLAAFVVAADGADVDPLGLRAGLARRVPGPMVPDMVQVLDELPILPGGKVDRQRLKAMSVSVPAQRPAADSDDEAVVLDLMAAALGRAFVGRHDDFFALGGDSLRAGRLFAELEARLGLRLPVSLLLETPTAAGLAAVLRRIDDPVVVLRVGDPSRPPLVIVHDATGDVLYARRMLEFIDAEQPVLGIRSQTLAGRRPDQSTLPEVATAYVEALEPHLGGRSVLLYGWSLGGNVAFEMARQLQERGQAVHLLMIGDSSAPLERLPTRREWRAARLRKRWQDIRTMPPHRVVAQSGRLVGNQVRHVGIVGLQRLGVVQPPATDLVQAQLDAGLPMTPELVQPFTMRVFGEMMRDYRPPARFDGSILLVRADSFDYRPDRGWSAHVTGSVETYDVHVAHDQLHMADNGDGVARRLQEALELQPQA
jgi:acyl-coenzyme A synthetase/AMP-(fatty) acid ligase/thioesterase domain-containing protein